MNTGTVAINSTDSLYPFSRIKAVDVSYLLGSNEGTTTPTTDDITDAGIEYIDANPDAGLPESTIKVDFVPLATTEEYKNLATLETVNLCDTAKIYYPSLGVSKSAKVVKTTYDVLNERYSAVEIGTLKQTLAQTIKTIFLTLFCVLVVVALLVVLYMLISQLVDFVVSIYGEVVYRFVKKV